MTAQELFRYQDPHQRKHSELIRGVMVVREPSGFDSSAIAARIGGFLAAYVFPRDLGELTGEAGGYVLARNPDTVRAPDVGFVRRDRLPHGERVPEFFDGAPDLAIEVLSPSDNRKKLRAKSYQYLAAGTSLVWVLDMWTKTATVYRPNMPPQILRGDDTLDGEDVIAGFRLPLTSVWRTY